MNQRAQELHLGGCAPERPLREDAAAAEADDALHLVRDSLALAKGVVRHGVVPVSLLLGPRRGLRHVDLTVASGSEPTTPERVKKL